jgi:hypothetical protein
MSHVVPEAVVRLKPSRCGGEILLDDAGVGLQHLGQARRSVGHADRGEADLGQKINPSGNETTATKLKTPSQRVSPACV